MTWSCQFNARLLALVFIASPAWAQTAPVPSQHPLTLTLKVLPNLVRFTTAGETLDWRLEVTNQQAQTVFDSDVITGTSLEWLLIDSQGQPVAGGLYNYTLTMRATGTTDVHTRHGQLMIAKDSKGYQVSAVTDLAAALADNGETLVTVDAAAETTAGVEAAGAGSNSLRQPFAVTFGVTPYISGTGTTGRVTRWSDGPNGIVGNTEMSESNGSLVVGNNSFTGNMQIFGPATSDVFTGMGPDVINGPAFNFGYAGSSFGRSAGFFNVRPDASAVAPNPSLRFMTANVERMIITNLGKVGIGNSNPFYFLDVAGLDGAIRGQGPGIGVNGFSNAGWGVFGDSSSGRGIYGRSTGGGTAVYAETTNGTGVHAASINGVGLRAQSEAGDAALVAFSSGGALAGRFTGNVRVSGNVAIGTEIADRPLTVLSGSGTYINIKGDNGSEEILIGADSSGGILSTMTNHDLQLRAGGNSTKVIVKAAGNVLPGVDALQYLGDPTHRWNTLFATNSMIQTSDARLKQRVENLTYGLSSVMLLRPVSFEWKDQSDPRRHLGLLAQEVEPIVPAVIERDPNPDIPLGLKYSELIPVVIKAIQEQQITIQEQRAAISQLTDENAALKVRLAAIEQTLMGGRRKQ